jgi:hypothetical protein
VERVEREPEAYLRDVDVDSKRRPRYQKGRAYRKVGKKKGIETS